MRTLSLRSAVEPVGPAWRWIVGGVLAVLLWLALAARVTAPAWLAPDKPAAPMPAPGATPTWAPADDADPMLRERALDRVGPLLRGSQVTVVGVRALPVQTLAGAEAARWAAFAGRRDRQAGTALYRHRVELRLHGPFTELNQVLAALEAGVAPLRLEQVLTSSADAGVTQQATMVLAAIRRSADGSAF